MADPITLARPYARASFRAALGADALADWSRMLGLAAKLTEQPAVQAALADPGRSRQETAAMFCELCGEDLNANSRNLVKLLAENKRLTLLPQIRSLFDEFKANQERSVDVELVAAFPVSEATVDQLERALRARLRRDIRLAASVDPALIGGAVIRAGDQIIDSSIRGKLDKLAETIRA